MAVTIKQEVSDYIENRVVVDLIPYEDVKVENFEKDEVILKELRVVLKRLNIPKSCQNDTTFDLKKFHFLDSQNAFSKETMGMCSSHNSLLTNENLVVLNVDSLRQNTNQQNETRNDPASALKKHTDEKQKKNPSSLVQTCTKSTKKNQSLVNNKKLKSFECKICKIKIYSEKWFIQHKENHMKYECHCPLCGLFFNSQHELQLHSTTHESCKHTCEVCKKTFTRMNLIEKHIFDDHFPDDSYRCELCKKAFLCKAQLKVHIKRGHNDKPNTFSGEAVAVPRLEIKEHQNEAFVKRKHAPCARIKVSFLSTCKLCNVDIFSEQWYNQHKSKHEKYMFYCFEGCQFFKSKSALKAHAATHRSTFTLTCDICDKTFTIKSSLRAHLGIHFPSELYNCKFCEKCFVNPKNLKKHVCLRREFHCTLCDKSFDYERMKRHKCKVKGNRKIILVKKYKEKSFNSSENSAVYWCEVCKIEIYSEGWYDEHKAKHKKYSFYCPEGCQFFSTRSDLNAHIKTHKNLFKVRCHFCEKTFDCRYDLRNHMTSHFLGKTRVCGLCKKVVGSDNMLKKHLKRYHYVKYECAICEKLFYWIPTLRRHMNSHQTQPEKSKSAMEKLIEERRVLMSKLTAGAGGTPETGKSRSKEGSRSKNSKSNSLKQETNHLILKNSPTNLSKFKNLKPRVLPSNKRKPPGSIRCVKCKASIFSEEWFEKHKAKHESNMLYCPQGCDFFSSVSALEKHMESHTQTLEFNCDVCKKTLKGRFGLKEHMQSHFPTKLHICDCCNKCFLSRSALYWHSKVTSGKRYECNACNRVFYYSVDAIKHKCFIEAEKRILFVKGGKEISGSSTAYLCQYCNIEIFTEKWYNEHNAMHKKNLFYCPEGCQFFDLRSDLDVHIKAHKTLFQRRCDMCNKVFQRKLDVRRHIDMHFRTESYFCKICKKTFRSSYVLKTHSKERKCALCDEKYFCLSLMNDHMIGHQAEKKAFRIKNKSAAFSHSENEEKPFGAFKSEIEIKEENPFEDNFFTLNYQQSGSGLWGFDSKNFSQQSSSGWENTETLSENPFNDEIKPFSESDATDHSYCKNNPKSRKRKLKEQVTSKSSASGGKKQDKRKKIKSYKWNSSCPGNPNLVIDNNLLEKLLKPKNLRPRVLEKNDNNRLILICQTCRAYIYSEEWYKEHKALHSKNMFYCTRCCQFFNSKSGLEIHMATHTTITKFKCDVCKKLLKSKVALTKHMTLHFPLESFTCKFCSREFKDKISLKRHLKDKLEKKYKCSVCNELFYTSWKHKCPIEKRVMTISYYNESSSLNSNSSVRYLCEICNVEIFTVEWYNFHMSKHESNCLICPEGCQFFNTQEELNDHVAVHKLLYLYICDICETSFKYKHNLVYHLKIVHFIREPPCIRVPSPVFATVFRHVDHSYCKDFQPVVKTE